jgi:hypothetical protein
MRVAAYARVSTTRQAQAQGIEQQLDRLRAAAAERGWELEDQHVYRDDGYSGARIGRPGLDRLRDHAALAELDIVLVTAPATKAARIPRDCACSSRVPASCGLVANSTSSGTPASSRRSETLWHGFHVPHA